jgi:two-component system, cell cycle sensor histidine kinase and response regulator CckA
VGKANILVVEDDFVIAKLLAESLQELGYQVAGIVSTGEEAVERAAKVHPDLVLMDIRLKGEMDGIEAGEQISGELHIPLVYLTAYSDERTVERAKITEPYGYLIKPFTDTELKTTLEMAIYKHRREKREREKGEWFLETLMAISDGIITTNPEGQVSFMNPAAELMTGWQAGESYLRPLPEVLRLVHGEGGSVVENLARRAAREENLVTTEGDEVLVAKNGSKWPVEGRFSPIRDPRGKSIGAVAIFRPRGGKDERTGDDLLAIKNIEGVFRSMAPDLLKQIDLDYLAGNPTRQGGKNPRGE